MTPPLNSSEIKSMAEVLDQDLNSPGAQHEAWPAYIAGQKHEG